MKNMMKVKEWIINWDNFRKVYLFLSLIYFMPSSFDVEYYPLWICFFWGILIIAVDFFTKREMFKSNYWYLLVIMAAVYFLSIIVNYEHQLIRGGYNWVYLATSFFIIYPINTEQSNESVKKNLVQFNNILIYTVLIASLISFLMFVFNISYIIPSGDVHARQGFFSTRLFGIYTSPNVGSIFGFLSIIASVLNNLVLREKWYKFSKLYLFNFVVQYLFYVLASSRGTQITALSFIMLSIMFIVIPFFVQKYKNKFKVILRTVIVFIAVFSVFFGLTNILQSGLSYVPGVVQQGLLEVGLKEPQRHKGNNNRKEIEEEDTEPIGRVVIEHSPEDAEVSSGRLTIWAAGLDVLKQFPLLGTADAYFYRGSVENNDQIDESKLSELDVSELKRSHGNMHNVYVQTLVMSGFLGFFVISIFMLLHVKDNTKNLLEFSKVTVNYQVIAITFFLLLSLLVQGLVESQIVFQVKNVVGIVFWYYLGLLQQFRKNKMFRPEVS